MYSGIPLTIGTRPLPSGLPALRPMQGKIAHHPCTPLLYGRLISPQTPFVRPSHVGIPGELHFLQKMYSRDAIQEIYTYSTIRIFLSLSPVVVVKLKILCSSQGTQPITPSYHYHSPN